MGLDAGQEVALVKGVTHFARDWGQAVRYLPGLVAVAVVLVMPSVWTVVEVGGDELVGGVVAVGCHLGCGEGLCEGKTVANGVVLVLEGGGEGVAVHVEANRKWSARDVGGKPWEHCNLPNPINRLAFQCTVAELDH